MLRTSYRLLRTNPVATGSRGSICPIRRIHSIQFTRTFATLNEKEKSKLSTTPLGQDKTMENNLKTETNRLSKTLSKFWEKVGTAYNPESNKTEVQLDGKALKTPLGFAVALPESKKNLAHLVAHEWANLPDLKVKTNALPITSVVARTIDLGTVYNGPNNEKDSSLTNVEEIATKIGDLEDIRLNILRYLDTDTCLIFTTKDEYEGKLRLRQDELYLPQIEEYNDFFTKWGEKNGLLASGQKVQLEYLDCETQGLRGNSQTITTQNVVLNWVESLSMYDLVALEKAILTTKSFLCGVTLLRSNCSNEEDIKNLYQFNKASADDYYFRTIDEIVELGNMEIIFQTGEWGEVEDTHDVDKVDWLRNLTSAAILCH
ncbi:protein Atp12p, mitochondrial [[Candida] railenensis]|uniref:Protein Atp12p, mitochondrial n=1 Tax=[Candida] railenensis TaxID=45579 RepID=A0A9P0VW85_9ASCO|nr:protein Atp12p, mitochondrial [[Candida] railenensis]